MLPNFIIIGAGKSGTTTLYEWLKQHPEVYMSPVKETNFFALEGEDVAEKTNDPKQLKHYPWSVTERNAYEDLFGEVSNEKAVGEVSPMYLYSDKAAYKIKETIPNVKIIAILRQPADRLHSRYMHLARESRQPAENYDQVFDKDSIWWERDDLVREGFYGQYLQKYYDMFDKQNIKVFLYEDLKNDPHALLKELFGFLDIDPNFQVDTSIKFNPSGKIKNPVLDKFIGQNSILKSALGNAAPAILNRLKESNAARKMLMKFRTSNLEKIPMSKDLREELINKIYGPEIKMTEQLITRDLSHWLNAN